MPVLMVLATQGAAHEYWLQPQAYQVPADGMLTADIVNGQEFDGTRLPYLPPRFSRFEVRQGDTAAPVEMRIGDRPAMDVPALGPGLNVVVHEAVPQPLTYDGWDAFLRFVAHKDLLGGTEAVTALQAERGLSREDVTELYSRHVKTLIAVGDGAGRDVRVGMETELVALENPYTDDLSDGLDVQLFYRDAPRADAQIEVFDRALGAEEVAISYIRTDAEGVATVPVEAGHEYMLDSVVLRVPEGDVGQMWDSLWANLTFAVPAD
ncbi:hypothetical protein Wenmar_03656 [Wenxinia marina DSM 24838]|uniref:ABC-type Co2+ transport system, periplasmic component n=2 Tax=Wenxinia TaxID=653686 RepID=A0A0D0Q5D0_9RHOB|nr:hypothetical protein Wenmar_03656 [Wenxinia marina DSM 24838]